jgi:hypothetical protein
VSVETPLGLLFQFLIFNVFNLSVKSIHFFYQRKPTLVRIYFGFNLVDGFEDFPGGNRVVSREIRQVYGSTGIQNAMLRIILRSSSKFLERAL